MSAIEKLPTEAIPDNGLLRFLTCGSVDDGKSTLIGRLLFDSKTILADTLHAIQRTSKKRGLDVVDLSLLTDGLQAEREQGITIDVAYRYFTTGTRKYIIADAPGHEQYTRNMVTAASTADLAIILIDARKGVLTQTRRHSYLAHLVGIPHIVVAVNKMDLVDYSPATFDRIRPTTWLSPQAGHHRRALHPDVGAQRRHDRRSRRASRLVRRADAARNPRDRPGLHGEHAEKFRFPVQYVCRPQDSANPELHDYRGFMGRVESGELADRRRGDRAALGAGNARQGHPDSRRVAAHVVAEQSVTILLEDEIDISRGDMIVKTGELPKVAKQIDAMLCWLSESPLDPRRKYLLRHTTRDSKAMLAGIAFRVDINTMEQQAAERLAMNDIAGSASSWRSRFSPTPTPRAAAPAPSSSSTNRRTTRSPRA
jgi:sulfate adenylyltransferase subunit 1